MKKLLSFIVFLCLPISLTFANINKNLQSYKVKANVKNLLKREVDSLIRTKLSEGSYQLDIDVKLAEKKPLDFEKRKMASELSSSEPNLRIKLFDLQRIIEAYKFNEPVKSVNGEGLPKIDSIDMTIGVSEHYKPKFRNEFYTWFKSALMKRVGQANVDFSVIVHPKDPEQEQAKKEAQQPQGPDPEMERLRNEIASLKEKIEDEIFDLNKGINDKITDAREDLRDDLNQEVANRIPASTPKKEPTLLQLLKDFQQLLSWLVFGIILFLSVRSFKKNFKSQIDLDSKNQTKGNTVSTGTMASTQSGSISGGPGSGGLAARQKDGDGSGEETDIIEIQAKRKANLKSVLKSFATEEFSNFPYVFDYWYHNEEHQQKKFWHLMSLCVSYKSTYPHLGELLEVYRSYIADNKLEWSDEIVSKLSNEDLEELERGIMKDIVRFKTFGQSSFKQSLSILQSLSDSDVPRMMSEVENEETLFLFLNNTQRNEYLKTLSEQKKMPLLEKAFSSLVVDHKALSQIERQVEAWVEINKTLDEVKQVSLAEKIVGTFSSFSLADKLKYLNHLRAQKPEAFNILRETHFHPLWFSALAPSHFEHFMGELSYKSILYIYTIDVSAKDKIEMYAPNRVVKMLQEEKLEQVKQDIVAGDTEFLSEEAEIQLQVQEYIKFKMLSLEELYEKKSTAKTNLSEAA